MVFVRTKVARSYWKLSRIYYSTEQMVLMPLTNLSGMSVVIKPFLFIAEIRSIRQSLCLLVSEVDFN